MEQDRIQKLWSSMSLQINLDKLQLDPSKTYRVDELAVSMSNPPPGVAPDATMRMDRHQVMGIMSDIVPEQTRAMSVRPFMVDETRQHDVESLKQGMTGGLPPSSEYEIGTILGTGGMGEVYRARQTSLQRDVALKLIKIKEHANLLRAKLVNEALVTGALQHPNIVPAYDLIQTQSGTPGLAMKLVEGVPWMGLLHPDTPEEHARAQELELSDHLDILVRVTNAVAFAHDRGVIHGDLKPENVMIGDYDEVLVMDWGCALDVFDYKRRGGPPLGMPREDLKFPQGTPFYMAPELALAQPERIGPWTDTYLLGAILYEVLTGWPPHRCKAKMVEVLLRAARSEIGALPDSVPRELQNICFRALSKEPIDRYQTAGEFRTALLHFIKTRESIELAERSRHILGALEDQLQHVSATQVEHNVLYLDYAQAIAGFEQSLVLWSENENARRGVTDARRALASAALRFGDLGLAQAHAETLPAHDAARAALLTQITSSRYERDLEGSQSKRLRTVLAGAGGLIFFLSLFSLIVIYQQSTESQRNEELAQKRLKEVQQLADIQTLRQLVKSEAELWPATGELVPALTKWLTEAQETTARAEGHKTRLSTLVAQATPSPDPKAAPTFSSREQQWEYDALKDLLEGLTKLETQVVPRVRERLTFAKEVRARTIVDAKRSWERARAAIREAPIYGGLDIKPQLGLVPLGPDPVSGLWEFGHIQTGSPAKPNADGRHTLKPGNGLILVLIPGADFKMGAQRDPNPRKKRRRRRKKTTPEVPPLPNLDARAQEAEGPVHTVTLGPFFISKYEMTQDQWKRLTGDNPSAWHPGQTVGDREISLLHPVEQIRWSDGKLWLERISLTLPTEAQWERATRAGTQTAYWTGASASSLKGAANLADRYALSHDAPGSWRFERWLRDGHTVHAPIGAYEPNPYGLHDMLGNVWEWCLDRYGPYTLKVKPSTGERRSPKSGPPVYRGGSYATNRVHARSADRSAIYAEGYRAFDVGLRPARLLDPTSRAAKH